LKVNAEGEAFIIFPPDPCMKDGHFIPEMPRDDKETFIAGFMRQDNGTAWS